MGIILIFGWIIIYSILDAYNDFIFQIRDNDTHARESIIVSLNCLTIGLLSILPSIKSIFNEFYQVIDIGLITIFLLATRWIFFDISYNLFANYKLTYIGNTSTMDKKIRGWKRVVLKSLCIIYVGFIIYIYL